VFGIFVRFSWHLEPRSALPGAACGVLRRPHVPNAGVCWVHFDIVMQQNKMPVQMSEFAAGLPPKWRRVGRVLAAS
jgi:hypothetical protein